MNWEKGNAKSWENAIGKRLGKIQIGKAEYKWEKVKWKKRQIEIIV
jgi:hypothetical protein